MDENLDEDRRSAAESRSKSPAREDEDAVLMDSDDDQTKADSPSNRRLKKVAAGEDVADNVVGSADGGQDNNEPDHHANKGNGSDVDSAASSRGNGSSEVGYNNSSYSKGRSGSNDGRDDRSGEDFQGFQSVRGRDPVSQSPASSSSHHARGSSRESRSHSNSHTNSSRSNRKDESRSRSRSRSRSGSRSRSEHNRPRSLSPSLYERLKNDPHWGKESWQDFELLQANVPGPGMKEFSGGVSSTQGGADSDMEMDDNECSCVPIGGADAFTCFDSSCHNYATMQECAEGRCHRGCRNQRIQRRENAKVEVFNADGKGMGLRLLAPVKKGDFIMEYVGEIITRKELNKRMLSSAGTRKLYMMQLGDTTYLDAKRKGGIARFVNHSCEPTCRLEQWTAMGKPRCAVFSLRDMEAGEELSFDYQWEAHELRQNTKCLCGTPSCRGTIEVLNPNGDTGGGPFARRARALAMGVWRTPKEDEYANPLGLVGRKVRVYFDGDCTFFEAKVMRYKEESKTHMLLYAGEGETVSDELEEDLIGVQGKIQGIDKWQIWEESDRVVNIKKKDPATSESNGAAGPDSSVANAKRPSRFDNPNANGVGRHFVGHFGAPPPPSMYPDMGVTPGMCFPPGMPGAGFGGMMAGPPLPFRAPPPPPPPPPPPTPVGPRVAENFCVNVKELPKVHDSSELVHRIKGRTGVSIELLEPEDPRAVLCPSGQRLLRVAGGRDQVMMAVDMLRAQQLSLLPLEDWVAAERKKKAQEEAEAKELETDAQTQVGRTRQRWCVGSDWHCFSKSVVAVLAANKVVADLRRNALHVVRQVADIGAGKSSVPSPLAFHACVLLHRYLAIVNTTPPSESSASGEPLSPDGDIENSKTSNRTSKNGNSKANGMSGASSALNGSTSSASGGAAKAVPGRPFRMETNFYVLATACLLLANKSLRARVGSAKPRRREELLRAAYGVQFRGRTVEKGTAEAAKWEAKLAAAELEVLAALGFDLHLTDPLEALDNQRGQKFISDAIHAKASALLVESVTQGCTAWLRFEPDVVALSILLLAIYRAESREELINRARTLAVNAGSTWRSVLACTQQLARSLPSMGGEKVEGEEGGANGAAAALRANVPTPDPLQYPGYEPPLVAAQTRLRQRRRAEDSVGDSQLRTTALLMMRKAQDRAGLHGGLGGLGLKGLAGFGSTLASNKFVRAAIREEDLVAAGLGCLLPSLESWKGFTVGGPLAGGDGGGRNVEVYLQRWPADKKDDSLTGCGLSSSGVSELALFQELHSFSSVPTGHSTLLVPLAVVVGTGTKSTGNKLGASGSKLSLASERNSKTTATGAEASMGKESSMTVGMDSLGMASDSMGLGDVDAVGGPGGAAAEGEGERNGASRIPEELLRPSYLLLEPVRYTLAEILRLCRRPMVLPGPLVRSLLQDLLGAVALCHDRNVVIKALDAEKVYLNPHGGLKLGCLTQAMMMNPNKDAAKDSASGAKGEVVDDDVEGDVDMEVEETAAGRKAAHREGKLRLKREKMARENACKKAVATFTKEGEPAKTVLWGMAPEVIVDLKHPHGPATDIWAVGCLAAQLALGKPIFGGRTRAQQLEYVFKCCGSPGQGRWPEGNKAPLYRHLRPMDNDGKSLHFKPRLAKVLSAEGNKGVPLDPALCDLLQGLLKLDSRHRISARDALASPYFAPRPGALEERYNAWTTLRGDLDKVQMGVATPDQLRGTYAAANAPTGHPPPPGPRGFVVPSDSPPPPPPRASSNQLHRNGQGRHGPSSSRGGRERVDRRMRQDEKGRGRWDIDDVTSSPPPPPPPRGSGHSQAIELPLQIVPSARSVVDATDAEGDYRSDRTRRSGRKKSDSQSPRSGSRRRSPANGRSRDNSDRNSHRDGEWDRDDREKDRKRKRDRERDRDTYGDRRGDRSGKDRKWSSRSRNVSGRNDYRSR